MKNIFIALFVTFLVLPAVGLADGPTRRQPLAAFQGQAGVDFRVVVSNGTNALSLGPLDVGGFGPPQEWAAAVGSGASFNCQTATYSTWKSVATPFVMDISSLPDGIGNICLVGRGLDPSN